MSQLLVKVQWMNRPVTLAGGEEQSRLFILPTSARRSVLAETIARHKENANIHFLLQRGLVLEWEDKCILRPGSVVHSR